MGWKNVKQHYPGVDRYIVCRSEKGICIGSPYVHNLITIADSDKPRDWRDASSESVTDIGHNISIIRLKYLGRDKPFDDWVEAMKADPATLRRLIDTPDTFEKAIVVYTYDYDGNIIEKLCEEPGWPNPTHDGDLQYDNSYSTDREEVVRWAIRNLESAVENGRRSMDQAIDELTEKHQRLKRYVAGLRKLRPVEE